MVYIFYKLKMEIAFRENCKKSMYTLITAIHYSNRNGLSLALDPNLGTEDVCKRQSLCSWIMLICGSKPLNPCLVEAPQGIGELGSIPAAGSELLLLNTKAGHVTVTYQQWHKSFSRPGFLRPCFSIIKSQP